MFIVFTIAAATDKSNKWGKGRNWARVKAAIAQDLHDEAKRGSLSLEKCRELSEKHGFGKNADHNILALASSLNLQSDCDEAINKAKTLPEGSGFDKELTLYTSEATFVQPLQSYEKRGYRNRVWGKYACMSLNEQDRKLAIRKTATDDWTIFAFSDVLGAELLVDDEVVTSTSSSRSITGAIIGGLAFGVAGAVVGGLGGSTESTATKEVKSITLRIRTNDMRNPVWDIYVERPAGLNVIPSSNSAPIYQVPEKLKEWIGNGNIWHARLRAVIDSEARR